MKKAKEKPTTFDLLLAIRDAQIGNSACVSVMLNLALRAKPNSSNNGTFSCFPSYKLIADDTGLGVRTVYRAVRQMREEGLLKIYKRPNQSNYFYLSYAAISTRAKTAKAQNLNLADYDPFGKEYPAATSPEFRTGDYSPDEDLQYAARFDWVAEEDHA